MGRPLSDPLAVLSCGEKSRGPGSARIPRRRSRSPELKLLISRPDATQIVNNLMSASGVLRKCSHFPGSRNSVSAGQDYLYRVGQNKPCRGDTRKKPGRHPGFRRFTRAGGVNNPSRPYRPCHRQALPEIRCLSSAFPPPWLPW